uniref:DDE_3 domain-containing protein n=1 Tax=Heterorhabditis bacteriophora TaxID=37862 RepID=A0A1I7XB91_HETBA
MSCASTLSLHERSQIKALSTAGYTVKRIADVKFNLDGPDSCHSYWRYLRKQPRHFSTRNFGGGSDVLGHRLRSPDLNPIENLWAIVVRRIYADNHQFETAKDLYSVISKAWSEVNKSVIKNLVNSMPERIFQGINRSGSCTDY